MLSVLEPGERARLREREAWYLGDREAMARELAGYPVNRDLKPVAEYFLGVGFRGGRRMEWRD